MAAPDEAVRVAFSPSVKAPAAAVFVTLSAAVPKVPPTRARPRLTLGVIAFAAARLKTAPLTVTGCVASAVLARPLAVPLETSVMSTVPVRAPAVPVLAFPKPTEIAVFVPSKLVIVPAALASPVRFAVAALSPSLKPSFAAELVIESADVPNVSPTWTFASVTELPITPGAANRKMLPAFTVMTCGVSEVVPSELVPAPFDVSATVTVPAFAPTVAVFRPTSRLVEFVSPGDSREIEPVVVAPPVAPV